MIEDDEGVGWMPVLDDATTCADLEQRLTEWADRCAAEFDEQLKDDADLSDRERVLLLSFARPLIHQMTRDAFERALRRLQR